jgi:Helicase conserved C-terminal domain
MVPFPHQIRNSEALLAAVRRYGVAADFSEPGVGKTLTSLLVAKQLDRPTLVVGPKISKTAWERTGDASGVPHCYLGWEKLRAGNTGAGQFSGSGRSRQWKFSPEVGFVILDEFHRAGGDRTDNSFIAKAIRDQRIPGLLLTATPAQDPLRMRALGYLLGLHNWRDFWFWCQSRGCHKLPFGGLGFTKNETRAARVLALLAQQMQPRMVKTRLSEVRPANTAQISPVLVDVDEQREAARLAEEIRAEYLRLKESAELLSAASAWQKARQAMELLKVPCFAERAKDRVEAGCTVLIFVQYRKTLEALHAIFPSAGLIHGDVEQPERQRVMDEMAADRLHMCLLQSDAGGESISLNDVTGKRLRVTLMSPVPRARQAKQIFGRTDRVNNKSPALIEIVLAAGTDEDRIQRNLERSLQNLETLTDADMN